MPKVNFHQIVEKIKDLSLEEKEEIKFLIERYLIEERREEIYRGYKKAYRN